MTQSWTALTYPLFLPLLMGMRRKAPPLCPALLLLLRQGMLLVGPLVVRGLQALQQTQQQ